MCFQIPDCHHLAWPGCPRRLLLRVQDVLLSVLPLEPGQAHGPAEMQALWPQGQLSSGADCL